MAPIESVAVFGSSEPADGEPLYELARGTGRVLALAGYQVVTGGYGGVMEGASRGAQEAGGETFGVLCDIFPHRSGNRFLTASVTTPDLLERTRVLIERSDAWVVLNGKAGTLAELTLVWALLRAGCLDPAPVILFGEGWDPVMEQLIRHNMLDPAQQEITRIASSLEEIVVILNNWAG